MSSKVNIAGFVTDSLVDGPGLRFAVFFQGCPHRCLGCHNIQTWDYSIKNEVFIDFLVDKWEKNKLIDGITFSGGEPFFQVEALYELVKKAKQNSLHVVVYTGYLFEELLKMPNKKVQEILSSIDILIDGPFMIEKRDESCKYCGSYNQRIIDLPKTLKTKSIATFSQKELDRLFL